MFCSIMSAAVSGVDAVPVRVETDVGTGMPYFTIVGNASLQVREAQDRVRTALKNQGIALPPKRITINLAPGELRKEGTRFDLPIAAGVLSAIGETDGAFFRDVMILGELHLDGKIGKVTGVLPSVLQAKEIGCRLCIVPMENLAEAKAIEGIESVGIRNLQELIRFAGGVMPDQNFTGKKEEEISERPVDFRDMRGQETVKRAALVAASGFHNLLLSGPPGSGKSMAAKRIATILPSLTLEESLEISKIYSIAGLLSEQNPLITKRPFRAPHHTVTPAALCGGGKIPRPGEVTLAHRGVLFLDELPEMKRDTMEMLRLPLEDRKITLSRMGGTYTFPAFFLLVAAMNPCPCGYYPDRNRCTCTPAERISYRHRISQAFMDRMDLKCEVKAVTYQNLTETEDADAAGKDGEGSSAAMRRKVEEACRIQQERYRGTGISFNSELGAAEIERFCARTPEADHMLESAFGALGLSARGYHHVLKVARTIADLDREEKICEAHISEALCFRCGK